MSPSCASTPAAPVGPGRRALARACALARALVLGLALGGGVARAEPAARLAIPPASAAEARAPLALPPGAALELDGLMLDGAEGPQRLVLRRLPDLPVPALVVDGRPQPLPPDAPPARFAGHLDGAPDRPALLTVDPAGAWRLRLQHAGREHLIEAKPGRAGLKARAGAPVAARPPFQCGLAGPAGASLRALPETLAAQARLQPSIDRLAAGARLGGARRRADLVVETNHALFVQLGSAEAVRQLVGDLLAFVDPPYRGEIHTRLNLLEVRVYSRAEDDPWGRLDETDELLPALRARGRAGAYPAAAHHVHLIAAGPNGSGRAFLGSLGDPDVRYGVTVLDTPAAPAGSAAFFEGAYILAHEIGHAFGSDHTHAFDRPFLGSSVGGAIDCCSADEADSQCGRRNGGTFADRRPGSLPGRGSLAGGVPGTLAGTIMSYCHLFRGGTAANVAFNFGTDHPFGIAPVRSADVMRGSAQARLPLDTVTLRVQRLGSGAGTVLSRPAGVECGGRCEAPYTAGSAVVLEAVPAAGSVFGGWGGACSGTGPCSLTLDADRLVLARFDPPPRSVPLKLGKLGEARGSVLSSPAGLACGPDCPAAVAEFPEGSVLTLRAEPAPGARFAGWGDDCSGQGLCSLALAGPRGVTARFEPAPVLGTELGAPSGGQLRARIDLPAGASQLRVETLGGQGDVDLYLRLGQDASVRRWDCRSEAEGPQETCTLSRPAGSPASTVHLLLHGYTAFRGVRLVASVQQDGETRSLPVHGLGP